MSLDLFVIGDCAVDLFMHIDSSNVLSESSDNKNKLCFIHGSKVPVDVYKQNFAGNPCHVGIGCSRLGLKTAIYTELGDDDYGKGFIKLFQKNNISTSYCRLIEKGFTNVHSIIAANDERTIFSYHEPRNYNFEFSELRETPKFIYYTSLAEGFEKFQTKFIDYLNLNPQVAVAYNPGSVMLNGDISYIHDILKYTHILFVNLQEAQKITNSNSTDLEELHKILSNLGPKITVITDGKNGSSTFDGSNYIHKEAPIINGKIIDKTGSGDAYAAAFLSAIFHRKSISTAMDWGNKNAASVVKIIGAVEGLLKIEEIV